MAKKKQTDLATPEELEDFQVFLFEMDDVLDAFLCDARDAGSSLDYSLESLDTLEELLISGAMAENAELLKNRAARYAGEVFRRNIGGTWALCLKNRRYLYFKLPVVTGYSSTHIEFCPIAVTGNFMYSREKGALRRAMGAHVEFADLT